MKYKITLDETTINTYWFEIEADSEEEAEEKALTKNLWDNDVKHTTEKPEYEVVEVEEMW